MRLARRMLVCGGASTPPDIETAYLQWNASNSYGYAPDALTGLATYTLAVKVTDWANVGDGVYGALLETYDATATALNGSNNVILTAVQTTASLYMRGAKSDGSTNWSTGTPSSFTAGVPKIVAITRTPAALKVRVISGGAVEYVVTAAPAVARDALHAAFGMRLDHAHGIAVPSQPGSAKQVAALVAAADVPDAQLIAWLAALTARGVVTGLTSYWPSSTAVGTTIPDNVGSHPATLVNTSSAALVPL